MDNRKKSNPQKLEKLEQGFSVYVRGANRDAIDERRKKEKQDIVQGRSRSKDTRKKWEVDPRQENVRNSEERSREHVEEVQPRRERKGWGAPRPTPGEEQPKNLSAISPKKTLYDDNHEDTDDSAEVRIKDSRDDEIAEKSQEEENEEIRNFITSMRNDDIEKLHQSLMGTMKEDELRKAMQEAKAMPQNDSPEKKRKKQPKDDDDDADNDEIEEDIDENPVEGEDEVPARNKNSVRAESSYYGVRPISVRKPRPISATYNQVVQARGVEPIMASVPFQNKQYDSVKKLESPKVGLSTPSSGSASHPKNTISQRGEMPMPMTPEIISKKDIKNREDVRMTPTSSQDVKHSLNSRPNLKPLSREEPKPSKGAENLLRRIESLDESRKQLLESILDKIERGEMSKEILLNLEFLNIKKDAKPKQEEEVKQSKEFKKDKARKQLPTKEELTLSSAVESKISKMTRKSQELEKPVRAIETHKPDYNVDEEVMSPIKEEVVVDKISPVKSDEIVKPTPKNIVIPQKNEMEDSLEKSSFAKKLFKDLNYSSNQDHIPPLRNQRITSQASEEAIKIPEQKSEPKPESRAGENRPIPALEHFIQFRIMSTWGSISQAGLTEVQIFNEDGEKIELKPSEFHLKNCGLSSIKTINKLINGVYNTTEDSNMWLCHMPAPPVTPELTVTLKSKKAVGAFRIWNYNKSLIDSIKGIKELEIIYNRNIVWCGVINRGSGNEIEPYHTEVLLKNNIALPKLEGPAFINRTPEPEVVEQKKDSLPILGKSSGEKNGSNPERSTSVPIWLQDANLKAKLPDASSFETKPVIGNASRRSSDRSAINLNINKSELDSSPANNSKNKGVGFQSLNEASSARNQSKPELGGNSANEDPESRRTPGDKVKVHPKINSPFKDVFDDKPALKKPEEKLQKPPLISEQKENVHGNKDDNSSINSVEYFNITNFGRLKPAKRESLQQVINLQQDVFEKIRDVQKRLDFKTTPIVDGSDILSQFDKGLKEEPSRPKLPAIGEPNSSTALDKKDLKQKPQQDKPKPYVDALDSMINKGSKSSEIEPSAQTKLTEKNLYENRSLRIPELPKGRVLKLCIYSTWGDAYYVGLNGIEFFNEKGDAIIVSDAKNQIRANPPDINCLPGYGKDPRTVDKLVDGTYLTCDDLHVWLAPYTQGGLHTVEVDFKEVKTISMIRIWNYNKSRIHSYRGARDVAIKLDDTVIFLGEISRAPGSLKGSDDCCEYILFTENENVLDKIDRNDWLNRVPKNESERSELNQTIERPMTGTRQFDANDLRQINDILNTPLVGPDGRPLTIANFGMSNEKNKIKEQIEKNNKELKRLENQEKVRQEKEKANLNKAMSIISSSPNSNYAEIKCKSLVITIIKSWGDAFYVGLTGLEVYDGEGNKIPLTMKNLNAKPRDMNAIPGYSGDHRTLDKVINNVNNTIKDENMWLIPYAPNQKHYLYINFDEARSISGVRIWNYNKNEEGSYRGARQITISADGTLLTPPSGILVKKAPGVDYYDFSQFIPLPFFDGWDEETVKLYKNIKPQQMQGFLTQEYDTPEFATGFLFKIRLLTTWGDMNYIGLNGIEFYDHRGDPMLNKSQKDYKIAAEPSSVSSLPGHESDIRTIDKLVNGVNETYDDRNMWLAPYLLERRDEGVFKTDHNELIITFDKPKIISCIKFWNYSKSPDRGVRELEILCDDIILYRGFLRLAPPESFGRGGKDIASTVLFTKNRDIIKKVDIDIYTEDSKPQKVDLFNEKQQAVNPIEARPQSQMSMERPTTSVKGAIPY